MRIVNFLIRRNRNGEYLNKYVNKYYEYNIL